jgi:hypothetical protein
LILGVAVLSHAQASDSCIVFVENGPQMQRGSAMLFLFLIPWVFLSLCTASPLPDVFWGFRR